MATWIKTNGSHSIVEPVNGVQFTLQEIQSYITDNHGNHTFTGINIPGGKVMLLNEDGIALDLPINDDACDLVTDEYLDEQGLVLGNVLVCDPDEAGYDDYDEDDEYDPVYGDEDY